MPLNLISSDPMFDALLNKRLNELTDRINSIENGDGLKSNAIKEKHISVNAVTERVIKEGSIDDSSVKPGGIDLGSIIIKDNSLLNEKLRDKTIGAGKLGDYEIDFGKIKRDRSLIHPDLLGGYINVFNGAFENLVEVGKTKRPNGWGVKTSHVWGSSSLSMVGGDSAYSEIGRNVVKMSGADAVEIESDFIPLEEGTAVKVQWGVTLSDGNERIDVKATYYDIDKSTVTGTSTLHGTESPASHKVYNIDDLPPASSRYVKITFGKQAQAVAPFDSWWDFVSVSPSFPYFRVYRISNFNILGQAGSWVTVREDTINSDIYSGYDTINFEYVVPEKHVGLWAIRSRVQVSGVNTNRRYRDGIFLNGSVAVEGDDVTTQGINDTARHSFDFMELKAGDLVKHRVWADDPNYSVLGGQNNTYFSGVRIS